jgi:hypothetical protein
MGTAGQTVALGFQGTVIGLEHEELFQMFQSRS